MSNVTSAQHLIKQPGEKRKIKFDFAAVLDTGEAISGTPIITSKKLGGDTSDLVISSVSVSGDEVHCFVESGTHAQRYRLEVTLDTDAGQILQADGILRVTDI